MATPQAPPPLDSGTAPLPARLLSAVRQGPGAWSHLAIAVLLAIFVGAAFYIGMVPTRHYPADNFWLPSVAWRLLWGQRPHVDFSSGVGPVSYIVTAVGIKLARGTADGVGYG